MDQFDDLNQTIIQMTMGTSSNLKLKFAEKGIPKWAQEYEYNSGVDIEAIALKVKKQGFISLEQLKAICEWKTHRSKKKVAVNTDAFVKEITSFCLTAKDERSRIEALTILDGVSWPTASVILHFCHQDQYPILDFRALESFGIKKKNIKYDFTFWWSYVEACRKISKNTGLDMRTIDKALWAYSKKG